MDVRTTTFQFFHRFNLLGLLFFWALFLNSGLTVRMVDAFLRNWKKKLNKYIEGNANKCLKY